MEMHRIQINGQDDSRRSLAVLHSGDKWEVLCPFVKDHFSTFLLPAFESNARAPKAWMICSALARFLNQLDRVRLLLLCLSQWNGRSAWDGCLASRIVITEAWAISYYWLIETYLSCPTAGDLGQGRVRKAIFKKPSVEQLEQFGTI